MSVDDAVAYVWDRLVAFGYCRPELIGARWALRIAPCGVDHTLFQTAWDVKGLAVLRAHQ